MSFTDTCKVVDNLRPPVPAPSRLCLLHPILRPQTIVLFVDTWFHVFHTVALSVAVLFQRAPESSAAGLGSVPEHEAQMCLTEEIRH